MKNNVTIIRLKWVKQREKHNDKTISFKNHLELAPLFSLIDRHLASHDNMLIAIDGFSTAGKTTFASFLGETFDANVFHTDDFFKKITTDPNDPQSVYGNNIDFDKMIESIIKPYHKLEPIIYRPFDVRTHQHLEPTLYSHRMITIIEGAYSMHPRLIDEYDLKIVMTTSRLSSYIRLFKRNGFKKLFDFILTWIPRERRYFKALNIKDDADVIIKR